MNEKENNKTTAFDKWIDSFKKYKLLKLPVSLYFKYKEIIMYLIFGVLTTLVDFAVYFPLANFFHVHYLIANTLAWIAAVLFAFVTNKLWVFESRSFAPKIVLKELVMFAGGRIVSLCVQQILLYITVDLAHINKNISKLAVSVIVIILNYVLSKLLVFRSKKNT